MLWVYFDASTLIKRYSLETGTPLINEIFDSQPASRMTCSTMGILEIISIQAEGVIVFDPEVDTVIQLHQLFNIPDPGSEEAPTSPEKWDVE